MILHNKLHNKITQQITQQDRDIPCPVFLHPNRTQESAANFSGAGRQYYVTGQPANPNETNKSKMKNSFPEDGRERVLFTLMAETLQTQTGQGFEAISLKNSQVILLQILYKYC